MHPKKRSPACPLVEEVKTGQIILATDAISLTSGTEKYIGLFLTFDGSKTSDTNSLQLTGRVQLALFLLSK